MIDIKPDPVFSTGVCDSRISIALFAALAFVIWDSAYMEKWFPSNDRENETVSANAALLIKSPEMTIQQQYTASSPVLDEIADQRGIKFRVIDDAPGEISGAPDWLQKLFLEHERKSPCLAIVDSRGGRKSYPAPSSVSEIRKRIGAK